MIVQNAASEASGSGPLLLLGAGALAVFVAWQMRREIGKAIGKGIVAGTRGMVRGVFKGKSALWPLYAGTGAGVAVILIRANAPAFWWTLALAGAVGAGIALWKAADRYRRFWMTSVPLVFGGYGAWLVANGVTGIGLLVGLVLGLVGNTPMWVEQYVSGEARIMARLQPERWALWTEAREMKGLKRGRITRTPMGLDVVVSLGGKLTVEGLNGRLRHIEAGLGTRRGAVRIEAHEMAHKATVRIQTRDPLKKNVPWVEPAGPVRLADPARLSMNAFGEWTEIDLKQRILVVGASGAGKSSVQRVLAAPVILAVDADLEIWDLKQGTESQHYEGKADVRIIDATAAAARIDWLLNVEFPRRAKILIRRGISTWEETEQDPARVVQVDEGSALVRGLDADYLRKFFTCVEQGRALGVYFWWATQFPKATNLPTEITVNMSAVVALTMKKAREARVVFDDAVKDGWMPHRLRGKGWLLLQDDDHTEPEETRAAYLDEKDFRKLTAHTVPAPAYAAPAAMVVPPMPGYAPTLPAQPVRGWFDAEMDEAVALAKTGYVPAQPQAPAEPALDEVPVAEAVLKALAGAPADGLSTSKLLLATGRGKSQVYAALQQLQDDGAVLKAGHGRYVLATAGEVTA